MPPKSKKSPKSPKKEKKTENKEEPGVLSGIIVAKRRKKKESRWFKLYIQKVLKQVHPDMKISKNALSQLNFFLKEFGARIAHGCFRLLTELPNAPKTISSREVQTMVRFLLPGELAKHAVSEGTKAVTKFVSAGKGGGGRREHKAGLQFSVSRVEKLLRIYGKRVGAGAPVYMAAIIEYLAAEILELAGNSARDRGTTVKKKIRRTKEEKAAMKSKDETKVSKSAKGEKSPRFSEDEYETFIMIESRDLFLATANDQELNTFMQDMNVEVLGNHTLPNVHAYLL